MRCSISSPVSEGLPLFPTHLLICPPEAPDTQTFRSRLQNVPLPPQKQPSPQVPPVSATLFLPGKNDTVSALSSLLRQMHSAIC